MFETVINPHDKYTRELRKGKGWSEPNMENIKRLMNRVTRTVPEFSFKARTHGELPTMCEAKVCYSGDRMVGLATYKFGRISRYFQVMNQDAVDLLRAQLETYGTLISQHAITTEAQEIPNQANILYNMENEVFGENDYLAEVMKKVPLSFEAAQDALIAKGTASVLLRHEDAMALIKQVADDYDLRNLTVSFFKDMGEGHTGRATKTVGVSLPTKMGMAINETTSLKHVVLHELAHVIEHWTHGDSGHGPIFQATYQELLNRYHDGVQLQDINSEEAQWARKEF